jgi:hypothetical protein
MLYNVRGFAEEEGWLDMANDHVLSRAHKWVQSQLLKTVGLSPHKRNKYKIRNRIFCLPSYLDLPSPLSCKLGLASSLKGLSHEIDFKTFDKNLQNLAKLRDVAGF